MRKKTPKQGTIEKKSMDESWLLSMSYVPSGAFQVVPMVKKNSPAKAGDIRDSGSIPRSEDPLKKSKATHSSILTWRIPWTEESSRLRSIGLQRIRHNWSDFALHTAHIFHLSLSLPNLSPYFALGGQFGTVKSSLTRFTSRNNY